MIIHMAVRTDQAPGKPARYVALCGYESSDKKEFRFLDYIKVTCKKCLERYKNE